MKKTLTILIGFILFNSYCFSQNFIHAYTNKTTFSNSGSIDRIATDNMNNVINATMFSGNITVGSTAYPSNGTISTMIIKRDDNDSLLWAKRLGCGNVVVVGGLFTDDLSNIYVTGYFGDSLNPTTLECSPFDIVNPDGYRNFVIKYGPDGTVLWSNSIKFAEGAAFTNADLYRITGNGTDRIAVTAQLYGVAPQTVGSSTIDPANGNLFYAVIDNNGNWLHANELGGTSMHICASIAMAANNDVFIAGEFRGSLNLGAAGTLTTLTSSPQDFICKADPNGNFSWAIMNDASSWWRPEVLAVNNDAYMIGSFGGPITFGTTTLNTSQYSTYMTKIDNAGNYVWAKKYGTNETTFFTATKKSNRIYISGSTSPSFAGNQFDTLNIVYANSLSPANTYSAISYLIVTDLDGFALEGAVYSFSFPTLNTQSMAASGTKTYLTGNASGIASFGGIVIDPVQVNSANYVAVFSDSANIVKGRTYYDFNSNNVYDASDINCGVKVTLTKGSIVQTSMANGPYKVGTDKGTYVSTITDAPLYYTYSPSSYTSVFATLANQVDSLNDFALQPIPNQNDLVIDLVLGQLNPGFSGTGFVTLRNIGTTPKTGVMSVVLNNPDITITACTPSANTIVGNTATLNYSLNPTEQISYAVNYYVSPTAVLSSAVLGTASAPDGTDLTPTNNVDTVNSILTGSYDPNYKEVTPGGNVTPAFIASETPLEYTIHFQNTGTDTAYTVVLRDTMSAFLNLSTFNYISSSSPVEINFYGNEVWFRFYNINLVDSMTNEPLSHGFVKYSIVPLTSCVLGDEIKNTAYIYFDFNAPIVTNTTNTLVSNVASLEETTDLSQPVLFPNPNIGETVHVKATSPITSITIYTMNGQQIKTITGSGTNHVSFPVYDLSKGIYFVEVLSDTGTSVLKLLMAE